MEQMRMVERVKGMPNFFAASAPGISPSACSMPVRPVGAMATGMATFCPIMVLAVLRFSMFTATWTGVSSGQEISHNSMAEYFKTQLQ
jgi:hypothetical protein